MSEIASLTEFLETAGGRLRFFDMGRRVSKIPHDDFLKFERTELPYPRPLQQQAWFALVFQDRESQDEPFIWFLHFPLDEQGKLVLASRDDFMHRLVESLGEKLKAASNGEQFQAALEDNPYVFQPKQERLAVLHAKLTLLLKQPASHYYDHAVGYFQGKLGWDQWSFLGYQGIADLAARFAEPEMARQIAEAIPHLPPSPLEALCHCLENESVPVAIAEALYKRVELTLAENEPDPQIVTAGIRGISNSISLTYRDKLIGSVLNHPIASRSDVLTAVGGRAWETLEDEGLRCRYLECLAASDESQDFFNRVLADLLFLPGTRSFMLASLRDPKRSETLSAAIGEFFSSIRSPVT